MSLSFPLTTEQFEGSSDVISTGRDLQCLTGGRFSVNDGSMERHILNIITGDGDPEISSGRGLNVLKLPA